LILFPFQKLQAAIDLQDLISLTLKADKNGDDMISDQEMDEFILRMRQYKGRGRREVDEDKLRKAFRQSITKTVGSLLQVTSSMMEDEDEEKKEQHAHNNTNHGVPADDAESQRAAVSRGIASAEDDTLTRAVYGDMEDLDDRQPELLPPAQSASSQLLSGLLSSNSQDFDLASLKSYNNKAKRTEKKDPTGFIELTEKKTQKKTQKKDPPTGFIALVMSMSTSVHTRTYE
jgi:hypothetical protein